MKLVINSSLCCRFSCRMCNQMWPSLGFTAINELRGCARGGERSAAALSSGSPGPGHGRPRPPPRRCLRASGLDVPARLLPGPPRPLPPAETRCRSCSQEPRLSGGPGWGEGGEYRPPLTAPAPLYGNTWGRRPPRPSFGAGGAGRTDAAGGLARPALRGTRGPSGVLWG